VLPKGENAMRKINKLINFRNYQNEDIGIKRLPHWNWSRAGVVVQVKESSTFQDCFRTLLNLLESQAHPKTICRRGEAEEVLNYSTDLQCVSVEA